MVAFRLSSENQLGRKFELTRRKICVDAADYSAARSVNASTWITWVNVVKRVECIHTELSTETLADRNALRYGDICIPLTAAVAYRVKFAQTCQEWSILIRVTRRANRNIHAIIRATRERHTEGQSTLNRNQRSDLVSADQGVGPSGHILEELPVSAQRQFVKTEQVKDLLLAELLRSINSMFVNGKVVAIVIHCLLPRVIRVQTQAL